MGPTSSLFLPDILPCPGPGLCDHHAGIFGGPNPTLQHHPTDWYCGGCDKNHKTVYTTAHHNRTKLGCSTSIPSSLEALPAEILLSILELLPPSNTTYLALASKTLCHKIGTEALKNRALEPLQPLGRDTPSYALCTWCGVLRPVGSAFAWGLLKSKRADRGVRQSAYAVSGFLGWKVAQYERNQCATETCLELLKCEGAYRKPVDVEERALLSGAGFDEQDLKAGLPIRFKAEGRVLPRESGSEGSRNRNSIVAHIAYRLTLPQPWTQFSISQRYAILRDWYLCSHTYASRIQFRDPSDPTYPAPWEPHQGPVPDSSWLCEECRTEFRGEWNGDGEGGDGVVLNMWQWSIAGCSDGMREDIVCSSEMGTGLGGIRRVRSLFEDAQKGT